MFYINTYSENKLKLITRYPGLVFKILFEKGKNHYFNVNIHLNSTVEIQLFNIIGRKKNKYVTKNDLIDVVAPETFGAMKGVAGRALVFLDSKLPLMFNVNPLLKKKYRPSTQEVYKFKKYLDLERLHV